MSECLHKSKLSFQAIFDRAYLCPIPCRRGQIGPISIGSIPCATRFDGHCYYKRIAAHGLLSLITRYTFKSICASACAGCHLYTLILASLEEQCLEEEANRRIRTRMYGPEAEPIYGPQVQVEMTAFFGYDSLPGDLLSSLHVSVVPTEVREKCETTPCPAYYIFFT